MTQTEKDSEARSRIIAGINIGGSFGGPIVRDRVHYFGAFERTQQDTFQVVNTQGLFPNEDGTFATPYRETLLTVKGTMNLNRSTTCRSATAGTRTPSRTVPIRCSRERLGHKRERLQFVQRESQLGAWRGEAQRVHLPVRRLPEPHRRQQQRSDPELPQWRHVGQNGNTPQTTEQKKYQFRNDFSWSMAGMGGLGHDFKAGVNYIHEPRLFITFNTGTNDYTYNHLDNDVNGPLSSVTRNGGAAEAKIPLDQYAFYIQDDWRLTGRLTLNLGLRYDVIDGIQIDQSFNPNFVKVQAPGRPACSRESRGWRTPGSIRRKTPTTGSRASASRMTCAATAGTSSAAAGASTPTWGTRTPTRCSPRSMRPVSVRRRLQR